MFLLCSSHAAPPPKSPRRPIVCHWTTRKALVFRGALAERGRVVEAARVVGMSRQSACRLRGRLDEGGTFARAWDQALAEGRETRRRSRMATPLRGESDNFGLGR